MKLIVGLLIVGIAAISALAAQQPEGGRCEYRGASESSEGRVWHWAYPYADEWSTKYEDMPTLLETHGASSPEDYFARFGHHTGYFTSGADTVSAGDAEIRPEAIEWSCAAQGLKGVESAAIARELSGLKTLRVFRYRAEWREDLRTAAYVPSLRRAVAIQIGY